VPVTKNVAAIFRATDWTPGEVEHLERALELYERKGNLVMAERAR
jgi:hypothetical protein